MGEFLYRRTRQILSSIRLSSSSKCRKQNCSGNHAGCGLVQSKNYDHLPYTIDLKNLKVSNEATQTLRTDQNMASLNTHKV